MSALCSDARETVVPASSTGSSTATGVSAPVRPTGTRLSRTFVRACSARELAEERRLAYVAVTRAAFWVACSGYWWGEAASPLGPSVFLAEVREVCAAGTGRIAHWAPSPDDDAQNPALAEPATMPWPGDRAGSRHAAVREAA